MIDVTKYLGEKSLDNYNTARDLVNLIDEAMVVTNNILFRDAVRYGLSKDSLLYLTKDRAKYKQMTVDQKIAGSEIIVWLGGAIPASNLRESCKLLQLNYELICETGAKKEKLDALDKQANLILSKYNELKAQEMLLKHFFISDFSENT